MFLVLSIVGTLAVLAGLAAAGFGFAIKEFSFGNALLIAGSAAIVGGLVALAAAAIVRELRKLIQVLTPRPGPRLPPPVQPRPAVRAVQEPARPAAEPPVAAIQPLELPSEKFLRSFERPTPPPEPMMVEDHEDIPLSPQPPMRAPSLFEQEPAAEPRVEPAAEPQPAAEEERAALETPQAPPAEGEAPGGPRTPFDAIWPASDRSARRAAMEQSWVESGAAATSEAERPHDDEAPQVVEEPRAVSILKSGVVDGMAYTLYADGSIEAELPDGTLRFASINELRLHLEKGG